MKDRVRNTITCIESEGYTVMNWKPGYKRVFKVLDARGYEVSQGMYSDELKAWYVGYLHGRSRR